MSEPLAESEAALREIRTELEAHSPDEWVMRLWAITNRVLSERTP